MGLFDLFKKKERQVGPETNDFSAIDSNQKAQALCNKGELAKLYLMPLDFGGEDSPINILFVPEFANKQKEEFDSMVYDLLESGKKLGYTARPEYKGKSFIPCRIVIDLKGDKTIREVIEIW